MRKKPKVASRYVHWLRGVGFAGIALGTFGLMKQFFWPSVTLVYAGLLSLIIDLSLESFRRLAKIAGSVLIIAVAVLFTLGVVLRQSPLNVNCIGNSSGIVRIVLNNASDSDDYHDLDVALETDSADALFYKATSEINFPSCEVVSQDIILRKKDESITLLDDAPGHWSILYKRLRLHCPLLPHQSSARIVVNIIANDSRQGPPRASTDWREIKAEGQFEGKFRMVEFSVESPKQ